jgi:transposase
MSTLAVGWDLHRKFSQVSLMRRSENGEIRVEQRARLEHADRAAMQQWLQRLPAATPVAMEGAFGWPWVADLLDEFGLEPHLGHPPALKVLAKNEAKCDRRDADRLGRFWLKGIFPESYLSTPAVRQIRERLRYRTALVGIRTGVKNRIQAILHRLGVLHSYSDLFGKSGRAWLETLALPAASREVLEGQLQLLDMLAELIGQVEAWMTLNLVDDREVRLLQTLPGIGLILAHVIRAEIGELTERFASAKKLVSYAGLAPLSDESADRRGRRHISPTCNHTLRWALIEAAGSVVRSPKSPPRLLRLYQRLTLGGRVNKNQAKVAVARELCQLVYVIWKKGEPYRECPPARPGTSQRVPR